MGALDIVLWPFRQLWAAMMNLWSWATTRLHLQDILLPAFYESLVWLSNQVPAALGGSTPGEMIEASFVLGVATFFSGILTGGLAWGFIAVWAFTGFLGMLRFFPVVNKYWPVPKFSFGDSGSLGILS